MVTQIVYSEKFHKHNEPSHPENANRLTAIMNDIKKTPFYDKPKASEHH